MMFTPRNQLQNMISAAASQVMVGNHIGENTARIIALQAQLELQEQHNQRYGTRKRWANNWF